MIDGLLFLLLLPIVVTFGYKLTGFVFGLLPSFNDSRELGQTLQKKLLENIKK